MGWSDIGDGCYDGDGPADAMGDAMHALALESRERTGKLPAAEAVLRAFVAALGLDGSNAPFYAEPKRALSMTVRRRGSPSSSVPST